MKPVIINTLKFLIIAILVIISSLAVLIGGIAFKRPTLVIDRLEKLVPTATPQPALRMNGIGILGDSQSDEYRADDNRGTNFSSTTLNWVELLKNERNITIGEWGVWGEPRRSGYAYNFARTGATTRSLIVSGQHTGLAEYVKAGKVNMVVIYIGANDFAPYITADGYEPIYYGTLSDAAIIDKQNRIIADITTAIDTLQLAGNTRMVLVLIPDWGHHIGVKTAFPFPDQREKVSMVIEDTNMRLEKIALERKILTINPNSFFDNLRRSEKSSRIVVGSIELEQLLLNNNPRNMYVDDGIHPGTIINGLFANEVIRKINAQVTNPIRPFTEQEILEAAGISQ